MTPSRFAPRPAQLLRIAFVFASVVFLAGPRARAADRVPIQITGYNIDAELKPDTHMLTCVTRVTFTALDPVQTAVFDLHGALKVDKVTDSKNISLSGERGAEATLRITPQTPLSKGQTYTWTFYYSGALESDAGGPVEGLKMAYVGDPASYLLYGGRWFPMVGYQTNRFTADIHVKVPTGYTVIGSGAQGSAKPAAGGENEYDFSWKKPGFPGTIIAGKFNPACFAGGEYPRLHHGCAQGGGARLRAECATHLCLLHVDFRTAGVEHSECCGAAGRYGADVLGSGDCGGGGKPHWR